MVMDTETAFNQDLARTQPNNRVERIKKRITDARSKMSLGNIQVQDLAQGSPALNAFLLFGGGKDILLALILFLWGLGQMLSAAKVSSQAQSK